MFRRNNKDPLRAVETEVDRLRERRDQLAARLRAASDDAEIKVRDQREALVNADLDGAAMRRAETECRDAVFRHHAIADALEETQRLLSEAETKLAADRDHAERAKVADDLERRADTIDSMAAEFPVVFAKVATLFEAFTQLVRTQGIRQELYPGLELSAQHLSLNVLHATVTAFLPAVQIAPRHADAPPSPAMADLVRQQMTDPMRALAGSIRAGAADIAKSLPTPPPEVRTAVLVPERDIVLLGPIRYVSADHRPIQVVGGPVRLPEPVVQAALMRRLGFEPGTEEAEAVLRDIAHNGTAYNFQGTWTDLGVDLSEHVAQERQRLSKAAA